MSMTAQGSFRLNSIWTLAFATSANGTGLLTNANVMDGLAYSGTGGITDTTNCQWENHAAANVPGLLFIQIYRKVAKLGKTCTE